MTRIIYPILVGLLIISNYANAQTFNLLKDINPGPGNSNPHIMAKDGSGFIYFYADDPTHGVELWKSNGTSTKFVKDINPGVGDGNPNSGIFFNGLLYFVANDGVNGTELWSSDGTPAGTLLVKDINPGAASGCSQYSGLYIFNGVFYFYATNGTNGRELWKSDGTTAGTVMIRDINVGSGNSNDGSPLFTSVGATLYFSANDGPGTTPGLHGQEPWKTDGTAGGTVMVKDINTHSYDFHPTGSNPGKFIDFNGTLIFDAQEYMDHEPWKSDGTTAGTVMLKDINPGSMGVGGAGEVGNSSNPDYFTVMGSSIYFSAEYYPDGKELWKSDGTTVGTVMIKDIYTGGSSTPGNGFRGYSSAPADLTVLGNKFYFSADNGNGRELWKSSGTTTGTILFKETNPSITVGGNPELLTLVNDKIYFRANNGTNGIELWSTDGTSGGTTMVQDIQPGASGSNPVQIFESAGKIFIVVTTAVYGTEIWVANTVLPPPIAAKGMEITEENNNIAVLKTNPVINDIQLSIKSANSDKVRWRLLDNNGRVVRSGYYSVSVGTTAITENTGHLAPGNYLLQLDGKFLQQTIKIVKE
jgi:ELWxxDGT repeat protein